EKFLAWSPELFFPGFLVFATIFILKKDYFNTPTTSFYWNLALGVFTFRVFYAFTATVTQYYVWSNHRISSYLLPPFQDVSYFINYTWLRMWLEICLLALLAFLFFSFLKLLKNYKERFFTAGEEELGLLLGLIVGWPDFLVFIGLGLLLVVLVSLLRKVFFEKKYTKLTPPLLVSAWIVLITGSWWVKALHLSVLQL
ncbi:MAG: hypothetical protein ABEI53_00885, partial [Candidatus Magasanikbacteria bacterium]